MNIKLYPKDFVYLFFILIYIILAFAGFSMFIGLTFGCIYGFINYKLIK